MPVVVHGQTDDLDHEIAEKYESGRLTESKRDAVGLRQVGFIHFVMKMFVGQTAFEDHHGKTGNNG